MFDKENKVLQGLEERIKNMSSGSGKAKSNKAQGRYVGSGLDLGFRIVADLVAGIVVGAGIGILLDSIFATAPGCLVAFLILGGFASFLNVYRTATSYEKNEELKQNEKKKV